MSGSNPDTSGKEANRPSDPSTCGSAVGCGFGANQTSISRLPPKLNSAHILYHSQLAPRACCPSHLKRDRPQQAAVSPALTAFCTPASQNQGQKRGVRSQESVVRRNPIDKSRRFEQGIIVPRTSVSRHKSFYFHAEINTFACTISNLADS